MTKERKISTTVGVREIEPLDETANVFLLTACLFQSPPSSVGLRDKETEALLTLRKTVTNLLLASLSNHCADLYGIHDHMQTLLGDEQYQECHHVLLLLYAACRESTPISAALVACHGELLIPYMWGAMQALENYLQSQDELYRRREDAHV